MRGLYRKTKTGYVGYLFEPVDFLEEALNDFLESGENPRKIVSCVIKTQTSIELIFKEVIKQICPALILEKVDDDGLQVAKVFNLGEKMLDKSVLEKTEIRTVNFTTLLKRFSKFYDIQTSFNKLLKLNQIRNGLVHHEISLEIGEVNLLLAKDIFPFLHSFLVSLNPNPSLPPKPGMLLMDLNKGLWDKLAKVEKEMVNKFGGTLTMKIEHFKQKSESLSEPQKESLAKCEVTIDENESILEENFDCPSCRNQNMAFVVGVDYDWNPDGVITNTYDYMKCPICGLKINSDEMDFIKNHKSKFFGKNPQKDWGGIDLIVEPD